MTKVILSHPNLALCSNVASNTALYTCITWGVKVTEANECDWLGMSNADDDRSKTSVFWDVCFSYKDKLKYLSIHNFLEAFITCCVISKNAK